MDNVKLGVKFSYVVLVIVIFTIVSFFIGYSIKKPKNITCQDSGITINQVVDDSVESESDISEQENSVGDNDGQENGVGDNDEHKVANLNVNFIKDTELKDTCTWNDKFSIKIKNGDIVFTNGKKTREYKGYHAKYLTTVGILDCSSADLVFLTEDGNLYRIEDMYYVLDSNTNLLYKESMPIKMADNVSGMIEHYSVIDKFNDVETSNYAIKTLSRDNEYINYYWYTFIGPHTDEEIDTVIKEY